jgi:hypothetical protein
MRALMYAPVIGVFGFASPEFAQKTISVREVMTKRKSIATSVDLSRRDKPRANSP